MKFIVGHLADAANVSVEGKLNLTGIFPAIGTPEVPCQVFCSLAALFEANPFDKGTVHPIRLELIDEDGREVCRMEGMQVEVPDHPDRLLQNCNIIINMRPLTLHRYGAHSFRVFLDDYLAGEIPLQVERI